MFTVSFVLPGCCSHHAMTAVVPMSWDCCWLNRLLTASHLTQPLPPWLSPSPTSMTHLLPLSSTTVLTWCLLILLLTLWWVVVLVTPVSLLSFCWHCVGLLLSLLLLFLFFHSADIVVGCCCPCYSCFSSFILLTLWWVVVLVTPVSLLSFCCHCSSFFFLFFSFIPDGWQGDKNGSISYSLPSLIPPLVQSSSCCAAVVGSWECVRDCCCLAIVVLTSCQETDIAPSTWTGK